MSGPVTTESFSSRQTLALHGIFFLSGAAALIFELLWFRFAALSFGNTLWAATAVFSAFMAGLAVGNAAAALWAAPSRHPLRLYAAAELFVGIFGCLLVFILPEIGKWIATPSRALLATGGGWPLQGLRLGLAFSLMLIPAIAMGLSLPLLARSLQSQANAGVTISRLYGWNTAGAVCGVLITEWLLLEYMGIAGSALTALTLCVVAALVAIRLNRPVHEHRVNEVAWNWRLAIAAALSGAIMLGLEVIWFRLLLLAMPGTDRSFAYLLALVLIGLSAGAFLASRLLKQRQATGPVICALALASALCTPLGYLALNLPINVWWRAALMVLPVAVLSGALLPYIATYLTQRSQNITASTGWMWLANAAGGAMGAALAGLYLLPQLGMQNSLLALGLAYLLLALVTLPEQRAWRPLLLMTCIVAVYGAVPHDWQQTQLETASAPYRALDNSKMIYRHEGIHETLQLLEKRKFGVPYSYRLITDSYSMSGTERDSQRYMKLFAWLPQTLHADPQDALLISYGVGSTASALLNDPRLQQLGIVDISDEILHTSSKIFDDDRNPLLDPRVNIFIEDGRQFLLVSNQQYDIITAEPPPPRMKGMVNLYSQEYFQLIRDRLKPQGMASYWLPVDQLSLMSSHAIIASFCAVFSDCSLWSGSNYNWVLLGGKDVKAELSNDQLTGLWQEPVNAQDLAALGFEQPPMLAASFLADAKQLRHWFGSGKALSDWWPKRLEGKTANAADIQAYADWSENIQAQKRFATSQWVQSTFPALYRAQALNLFEIQPILNNELPADPMLHIPLVHRLLTETEYHTPIYWLLDSDLEEQKIIDQLLDEGYQTAFAYPLAVRALAEKNFEAAASLFQEALQMGNKDALGPGVYSLCRMGRFDAAKRLATQASTELSFKCWPTP